MSAEEFRFLAEKLRPYSDYLYLHVMGEPLLHPQLAQLLKIAKALNFSVVVTTNGTLLPKTQEVLLSCGCLHKVHVSLHSFEANEGGNLSDYVRGCTEFAKKAAEKGILINFRLWNLDGENTRGKNERNGELLEHLHEAFAASWKENTGGFRVQNGVFVQYAERFEWPDIGKEELRSHGLCYALRKQLAVLCDGSVVPCCLDHEGDLSLGNLFEKSLEEILQSPLAMQVLQGVSGRGSLPELCRRCGYAQRFSK